MVLSRFELPLEVIAKLQVTREFGYGFRSVSRCFGSRYFFIVSTIAMLKLKSAHHFLFYALMFIGCTAQNCLAAEPQSPDSLDNLSNIGTRTLGIDWPSFLGSEHNSRSPETGIVWPAAGLKVVWQKELGISYGIGSVAKGRYYQYDRFDDVQRLTCLNAETGKELWKFEHSVEYEDLYGYNGGPRCSPVIDGNRVYIYGVAGWLHCLRADNGELVWKVDTVTKFGVVQNFFGVGSTPVISGDLLIVMVGGSDEESQKLPPGRLDLVAGDGSGLVAFDKRNGEVKWKLTDELASYSSPTLATIDGRPWGFAFCRGGLVGFDPAKGKVDFEFPWRARKMESVNAATPIVMKNEVFISECYELGSALLKVAPGDHKVVWSDDPRKREKSLEAHWNTPIFHEGYLYGSSGRHSENAELRCIEWKTGKVMWSKEDTTRTSLLYVDGHLINLGEYGNLQLLKASPTGYDLVREFTPRIDGPGSPQLLQYPCWAAPILSHGLLYVRGKNRLVCYELIPEK